MSMRSLSESMATLKVTSSALRAELTLLASVSHETADDVVEDMKRVEAAADEAKSSTSSVYNQGDGGSLQSLVESINAHSGH